MKLNSVSREIRLKRTEQTAEQEKAADNFSKKMDESKKSGEKFCKEHPVASQFIAGSAATGLSMAAAVATGGLSKITIAVGGVVGGGASNVISSNSDKITTSLIQAAKTQKELQKVKEAYGDY